MFDFGAPSAPVANWGVLGFPEALTIYNFIYSRFPSTAGSGHSPSMATRFRRVGLGASCRLHPRPADSLQTGLAEAPEETWFCGVNLAQLVPGRLKRHTFVGASRQVAQVDQQAHRKVVLAGLFRMHQRRHVLPRGLLTFCQLIEIPGSGFRRLPRLTRLFRSLALGSLPGFLI